MNFNEKLDEFVEALTEKYGNREHGTERFEIAGGTKFVRIAACRGPAEEPVSRSAYCFVAREDGYNRKLGSFSKGDVFKPDGWKGPAKTARGNIFSFDGGLDCCDEYGVARLRC